jgi:hypothetical protein
VDADFDAFADRDHVLVTSEGGAGARLWRVPLDGAPATLEREWPAKAALVTQDESRVALVQDEVVRMEPLDGGPSVQVASAEPVTFMSFSPDLRHLAFGDQSAEDLTIAAADGSGQARVKLGGPLNTGLLWDRPDRILFSRGPSYGDGCVLFELRVDAEGRPLSPPRELWRPHATWLSGLSSQGDRYSVVVASQHRELDVADLAPDARRLIGAPRPLTPQKSNIGWAVWLDESRLAFWSDRDGRSAVYEQAASGTEAKMRLHTNAYPFLAALRPGQLLVSSPTGPGDAGALHLVAQGDDGSEREVLSAFSPYDAVRCAARAPSHCVLGSLRDHATQLASLDLATGHAGAPFFVKSKGLSFAVSPDGKRVAVVDNSPLLTLVDIATGQARSITVTPSGPNTLLQSVEFASDGQTLLLSGMGFPGANSYALIAVGLDGRGTVLRATRSTWMFGPSVSPDGRHLAFESISHDSDVWLLEPK